MNNQRYINDMLIRITVLADTAAKITANPSLVPDEHHDIIIDGLVAEQHKLIRLVNEEYNLVKDGFNPYVKIAD